MAESNPKKTTYEILQYPWCHGGTEWVESGLLESDELAFGSQLSYSLAIRTWERYFTLSLNVLYVQILLACQTKLTS